MRRLREWKVMNPSPSNSVTGSTTSTSKKYKNRFTKLLDYAEAQGKAATVVKTLITNITNNSFHYTVYYEKDNSKWTTDLLVATSRFTDDWTVQFYRDGELIGSKHGKGYEELLNALSFYLEIPSVGTPEYNNILIEAAELTNEFKEYETLWD